MWIWRDARERWLLATVVAAFVLVCIVNARLPLWVELNGGRMASFLRADSTASVTSDLLVGIISAYIFYVIIELLPSYRRKTETLKVLNLLVASVIDAFDRTRLFGHETPITSIDLGVLRIEQLKSNISAIKTGPEFLRLKFAMETGHSRYQDFQHALTLAVGLSPEHALSWLVLTDKIRLLAQEYGTQPIDPSSDGPARFTTVNFDDIKAYGDYVEKMSLFESTLQLRVLEVFESSVNWMKSQSLETRGK
ncbi:hypothetical protein [Pseudomonas capeferrum]